jgi:hypothetical protein
MTLRITRAIDPITVERLVLCVYSPPGLGKTTLAFTAENPLLLDFDSGVHRAGGRKDAVLVNSWAEVDSISADDLKGYKTLIVDTAGRALDSLTTEIIRTNPKMGRGGGALTLQGYGELKSRFISFTRLVRSFGLDVVLLAHSDEQRDGDTLIERIDVQGGSKNEIYKAADVMGRLSMRGGKRYLNFSPSDTSFGKNPADLPELAVPNINDNPNFLAEVITSVKSALNRLTKGQQEAATLLAAWQIRFDSAESPEQINGLIPEVAQLPASALDNVKRLLVKVGKEKGWEWDKDAKKFAPLAVPSNGQSNGFNPLSQTSKDGLTRKQAQSIQELARDVGITDLDKAASTLFSLPLKVDELSREGADRFIADLTAQYESAERAF